MADPLFPLPDSPVPRPAPSLWRDFGFWAVAFLIVVGTLTVYGGSLAFDFFGWDDPAYVTDNPWTRQGLVPATLQAAFASFQTGNWHPLTMLTHALDVTLFGLDAGAHRAINIGLHLANSLLLFVFLRRATGARWRSALAALVFAWHPVHVESVVWIAERKDVLCAFFWLLAMLAYLHHVRERSARRYLLVTLALTAALLAKPMAVTLPLALLLLDAWPLRDVPVVDWKRRLVEKLPWLALAFASALLTLQAQHGYGAVVRIELRPLAERLANALHSLYAYMGSVIWPVDLSFFYVFRPVPGWMTLLESTGLAGLAWLAWRLRGRRPLWIGLAWFVLTLLPVLGLIQVGSQARADRYLYLPMIGLLLLPWAIERWPATSRLRPGLLTLAGSLALLLAIGAQRQVMTWQDDTSRALQALRRDPAHAVAHIHLATVSLRTARPDAALQHALAAWEAGTHPAAAAAMLSQVALGRGNPDLALTWARRALEIGPDEENVHYNLGVLLLARGNYAEAVPAFREAARRRPSDIGAHNNLGTALWLNGQRMDAIAAFRAAVALAPRDPTALGNLARALEESGDHAAAAAGYRTLLEADPGNAAARQGLERTGGRK